jgi:hypothetical protein
MREAYGVEQAIERAGCWFAQEVAASRDVERTLAAAALRLTGVLDGMGFEPAVVEDLVREVRTELEIAVARIRSGAEGTGG